MCSDIEFPHGRFPGSERTSWLGWKQFSITLDDARTDLVMQLWVCYWCLKEVAKGVGDKEEGGDLIQTDLTSYFPAPSRKAIKFWYQWVDALRKLMSSYHLNSQVDTTISIYELWRGSQNPTCIRKWHAKKSLREEWEKQRSRLLKQDEFMNCLPLWPARAHSTDDMI